MGKWWGISDPESGQRPIVPWVDQGESEMHAKVNQIGGNDKPSAEKLVEQMREHLAEAVQALSRGEDEVALTRLQVVQEIKHQLWLDLMPRVRVLARRLALFTRRKAGLTEDDLVGEAYVKFLKVLRCWDAGRGASVTGWVLFTLSRYFIQLGRAGRWVRVEDLDRLEAACPTRGASLPCRVELDDIIDRLLPDDPQRQRKQQVFRMYWFEGWTMPDLARQESVSVSTIHHWLTQIGTAFAELYLAGDAADQRAAG